MSCQGKCVTRDSCIRPKPNGQAALIESVKQGPEVATGEGPVKGAGGLGEPGLEAENAFGQLVEAGEVAGRQPLACEDRDVDLDLRCRYPSPYTVSRRPDKTAPLLIRPNP